MNHAELEAVAADIGTNDCRVPVAICDGPCYSTAGTARLRANGRVCRSRGRPCGPSPPRDAAPAVTNLNLQRRRMDESPQRALAAAKLANLGAGRPPAAGTARTGRRGGRDGRLPARAGW